MGYNLYSTVPPCLQEARSRREQRAKTGAEQKRGGPTGGGRTAFAQPQGLEPRREQAQRDNLPLVLRFNGRTRPIPHGRLGSGTAAALRGALPPNASLSVRRFAVSSPSSPF